MTPAKPSAAPLKSTGIADGLALPHERDQGPNAVAPAPDAVIEQAKKDLDAGLVDTDMHATPGLDSHLRRKLVPGVGPQ